MGDSDFAVDCTRFRENHMVFRGNEKGGGGGDHSRQQSIKQGTIENWMLVNSLKEVEGEEIMRILLSLMGDQVKFYVFFRDGRWRRTILLAQVHLDGAPGLRWEF